MDADTDIGGGSDRFPATRHSVIAATASSDPEVRRRAYEALVAAYWKPVYKYVRLKWGYSNEDAKDLTQAFFTRAMEKDFFAGYDQRLARFRTYLRTCLDRFVANERKAAGRIKRGGGAQILSLDFEGVESEVQGQLADSPPDMDELFHKEWVRSLFSLAVDDLRESLTADGKSVHFELFRRYDLEGPEESERATYEQLAREHDLTGSQVTNYLALARRLFRGAVLARLRAISGSDEEYREEARELLGIELD